MECGVQSSLMLSNAIHSGVCKNAITLACMSGHEVEMELNAERGDQPTFA